MRAERREMQKDGYGEPQDSMERFEEPSESTQGKSEENGLQFAVYYQ